MGRRTLLLIASILVAAVGTALIGLYVRGADDRARQNVESTNALVALTEIPANSTPGGTEYGTASRVRGELPRDVVTDADQIKGMKAVTTILPGQVLQQQMFSTEGNTTEANVVSKGYVGVAFDLGDPERVAGLLTPGSWVYVYATDKPGGSAKPNLIKPVFGYDTQIKVLAIGSQALDEADPVSGTVQDTDVPEPWSPSI